MFLYALRVDEVGLDTGSTAAMPGVVAATIEVHYGNKNISRPCIVDDMIYYVCFRSPHHERNRFRKTWKSLLPYIVTAHPMGRGGGKC